MDRIYLADWGFVGLLETQYPSWIKYKDENIKEGIIFSIAPDMKDIGREYTIYFNLEDDNQNSKSARFEFKVIIVDPNEVLDKFRKK